MPEPLVIKQEPTGAMAPDAIDLSGDEQVELKGPDGQLLAGKYKSVGELEKAYKELQSKLGSREPVDNEVDNEPAEVDEEAEAEEQTQSASEIYGDFVGNRLEEAGIDYNDINVRWQQTGELSDGDYKQLEGAGFTRQMVDAYLSGLQYKAAQDTALTAREVMDVKSQYGGEQGYSEMLQWAGQNLSQEEINAFNKIVNGSNDMAQVKLAVAGLHSRYTAAEGREPRLLAGRSTRSAGEKYESTAQLVEAMSDPKYKSDPAYRRKVQERLARSSVF